MVVQDKTAFPMIPHIDLFLKITQRELLKCEHECSVVSSSSHYTKIQATLMSHSIFYSYRFRGRHYVTRARFEYNRFNKLPFKVNITDREECACNNGVLDDLNHWLFSCSFRKPLSI